MGRQEKGGRGQMGQSINQKHERYSSKARPYNERRRDSDANLLTQNRGGRRAKGMEEAQTRRQT